jgi:hypothetical protein
MNGRGSKARTYDLRFWRPPLYQLSYTPKSPALLPKAKRHMKSAGYYSVWPELTSAFAGKKKEFRIQARFSRRDICGSQRHIFAPVMVFLKAEHLTDLPVGKQPLVIGDFAGKRHIREIAGGQFP